MAFPRLEQMHAMFEAAEKAGSLVDQSKIPRRARNSRPFRQLDFGEEWKLLKKAWSLARNDKSKLSKQRIAAGSDEFYANDPLKSLEDWVWRFALFICQPGYEQVFRDAIKVLEPLGAADLTEFGKAYDELSSERGNRYFSVMKDFFAAFSEFTQVYLFVAKGLELPRDYHATSVDFDAVKMFYGNAFEHFTSLVEILALLNNILMGRPYDRFQTLTLSQYRELDKPSRFGPFSINAVFMAICSEADNQIRNAFHHGAFVFEEADQIIRYRAGKGGVGPERQISYVSYLERCVRIFLQCMTLLRIELIISHNLGLRPPL